ncbi:MAG: acyl carrier protein [Gammaproteobacteria bacterium]|nr:acyl carrier protein [Gammaproteobacteria bacterium]
MEKKQFLLLLDELLELDNGTLQGSELLADLEAWDSLAAMGFIALVDENCGKIISPSGLVKAKTVNDLIKLAE